MDLRHNNSLFVEAAPSLFITAKGGWTTRLPVGAYVIGHLGFGIPDEGIKRSVLAGDDPKQAIIDKLGLFGDTKELFSTAWDIGTTVSGVYGYIGAAEKLLKVIGALPTEDSPEMKLLKALSAKVAQAVNLLKLQSEVDIATKIANIENARADVENTARNFLTSQTPEEWKDLKTKLETLQNSVWSELFNPEISLSYMKTGWDLQDYFGTPWYYSVFKWGFERSSLAPPEEEGIPVLGTLAPGQGRWDFRPWLGLLARTVVTLMLGHLALDPACRTTGVYRSYLQGFADGLRVIGRRMIACIQVTHPLDLHKEWNAYKSGGYWGYDVLANGWPVGAVDSILGAAIFDSAWKPSAHGFPLLDTIKGVPLGIGDGAITRGDPPPAPWTWAYFGAVAKAEVERNKAWFDLVASSAASKLYALASEFDNLATPPNWKKSETVVMDGPEWAGLRVASGTQEITIGGTFCEKKSFTADIYKLRRVATTRISVQPTLFHWGSHQIKYRFYLESYSSTAPELYSSTPWGYRVDQQELAPGAGTVHLKVRTFHWDIEKPLMVSDQLSDDKNVVYVISPTPPVGYAHQFQLPPEGLKVGSIAMQFPKGKLDLANLVANAPLEERKGRLTPTGDTKSLPFHCERTDEDGLVTILLKMDLGQSNSLVWLVVEEPLGNVTTGNPQSLPPTKVIRTVIPLAMIGIERHLPKSYFAHVDFCEDQAAKALMDSVNTAQKKGLPIPQPDPRVDRTYVSYVRRVTRELRGESPHRDMVMLTHDE